MASNYIAVTSPLSVSRSRLIWKTANAFAWCLNRGARDAVFPRMHSATCGTAKSVNTSSAGGNRSLLQHGYDVIVGGELFTDYSDHPRKLVTLHPKLKSTAAGRYQLLSRWWDAYRKQLGLKDFSPKSQDAVALQQIKERGALPMIDRGDIRQAIDRCSNIWASLPGAGYGQFEHKADSLIAKFKEAGGTVRESEV